MIHSIRLDQIEMNMKKIILTPMEENKYNIIKELVDYSGNKRRAALQLNCSD